MKQLLLLFAMALTIQMYSQNCPEYPKLMRDGQDFFALKQYRKALNKYNAAKLCMPSKTTEVDIKINQVFDAIEKEKNDAIAQKQIAINEQKKTESILREMEKKDKSIDSMKNELVEYKKVSNARMRNTLAQMGLDTSDAMLEDLETNNSVNEVSASSAFSGAPKQLLSSKNSILRTALFLNANNTINSLFTQYKLKGNSVNTLDDETAMALIQNRLENDTKENTVAKHLLDSSKNELNKIKKDAKEFDFVAYIYLRSALYYSWNLTGLKKYDSAFQILNEAESFIKQLPHKSAALYSGIAAIYNSFSNYYTAQNQEKNSFEAIKLAVENGTSAVKANPNNYLYQRGLGTLLNNLTIVSDSLLSKYDKVEIARLTYKCLFNLETYYPLKNLSLDSYIRFGAINFADKLLDAGLFTNAADTLKEAINLTDQYIKSNTIGDKGYLQKLKLLTKVSGIYVDSLKNLSLGNKYLNESYTLFNSIKFDTSAYSDADQLVELNSYLENLLKLSTTKADSISTLPTFSNSILAFEKINPLIRSRYKKFSEDVYRFIVPYSQRLALNISMNKKENAAKDFNTVKSIFYPLYLKYRFDFYLGQPIIKDFKIYGNYLCQQKKYNEAIPLLKFASLEGIKESTDSLISIYQKRGFKNTDSLNFYTKRTSYQSSGMKRFTIPTDFDGVKYPFNVYITDKAKEYDTAYTGIRDQAQWVREARGGKIPDDVISSFDKLQKIAWDNDVSFMDLSVYALAEANKDTNTKKAETLQQTLNKKLKNKTVSEMLTVLESYTAQNDTTAIDYITRQIRYTDSVNTNDAKLSTVFYQLLTGFTKVDFSSFSADKLNTYRKYFLSRGAGSLKSNELRSEYYFNLTQLDSLYYLQLTRKERLQEDSAIGSHYNSMAWYCLLTKQFDKVVDYLNASIKYDPKSPFPIGNLPHAYLFTNQFEKAKEMYLQLKDKPFNEDYPTYKDAFLDDFNTFEKVGITGENIKEIIRLLNGK